MGVVYILFACVCCALTARSDALMAATAKDVNSNAEERLRSLLEMPVIPNQQEFLVNNFLSKQGAAQTKKIELLPDWDQHTLFTITLIKTETNKH